jgi:hypothetical protein
MSWKNIDLASQERYAKSIFQLICKQVNENESSAYSVIRIYTPSDKKESERGAKQTLLSVCLHVSIPVEEEEEKAEHRRQIVLSEISEQLKCTESLAYL